MSADKPKHIAIVGCGFTGTTALHQLVHHYPVRKITIFEAGEEFGPGFPYSPREAPDYLINNTNDTMCLEPTNRQAFVEWLRNHDRYSHSLDEGGHMPRAVYGEFLVDTIRQCRQIADQKGIELEFVHEECADIEEHDDHSVTLHWRGGMTDADMVILATGRCPDIDVFGLDSEENYFATHMPGNQLAPLPLDAEVHVIGASLSAYDVVNLMFSPDTGASFEAAAPGKLRLAPGPNQRRVILCSRSGRLKKAQSRYPGKILRRHFNAEAIDGMAKRATSLEEMIGLMIADAEDNGVLVKPDLVKHPYAGCRNIEDVTARAAEILRFDIEEALSPETGANFMVDYLADAQFDIWDLFARKKLTEQDELRYRQLIESPYLCWGAPCPIPTAQKILALIEAGRLRILTGTRSITAGDGGSFAIEHEFGTEPATVIVNATGAVNRDVESPGQPELIRNLVRRGLVRPYRLGGDKSPGAAVDMASYRCEGSTSIFAVNMLLWGPGHFTSSAIAMATSVRDLLARRFRG